MSSRQTEEGSRLKRTRTSFLRTESNHEGDPRPLTGGRGRVSLERADENCDFLTHLRFTPERLTQYRGKVH